VITELEFKSLAAQGYNRIPLLIEAFADLETPLSLYLKLAHANGDGKQLLAGIRRRRRALRPLQLHRPAGTQLCARLGFGAQARTEVVTDGKVVETAGGNPLDFIAAYQQRFKVARRRHAALLRRPGRLLRL
jgi:anthranilate synthase component 1